MKRVLKFGSLLVAILVTMLVVLVAYLYFRPNQAQINPSLEFEHWAAVSDGMHNSNTDFIYWRDAFYLIHASSPWHFGSSECKLVLWRSADAKAWERVAEFDAPGDNDIRDPKFAAIGDRLLLYVLINETVLAVPVSTSLTTSEDGQTWTPIREIEPKGWLFWKPKTLDGETWYCPAYWHEHGKSILLKSTDGENWEQVSVIHEGEANDETDIEFMPDGRMIATARLEVKADTVFGNKNASTMICVADPPYTEWQQTRSTVTRLDGPCLFTYNGEVYAFGRKNPDPNRFPTNTASVLGRKRTALYKVEPGRLIWLTDLPSAGDTSYTGAVVQGDTIYACYYTSDITKDWPWIIGMLSPSEIRMVKIDLPSLAALAPK